MARKGMRVRMYTEEAHMGSLVWSSQRRAMSWRRGAEVPRCAGSLRASRLALLPGDAGDDAEDA
jgi:hypothetical protein